MSFKTFSLSYVSIRTGCNMKRRTIALTSVVAVAVFAATGFFLIQRDHNFTPAETSQSAVSVRHSPTSKEEQGLEPESTNSAPQKYITARTAQTDAETAYELVEINLRCQIDRDASANGEHIRITPEGLCKDLSLKPLSREEIFKAITYAAEHGNIKAQLDYSLYASRIFEDELHSLDPDLIREYKDNTVRFLEAAGSAGQPQAYARLSDIYKNGALASKDPVMAYAYAEAYFRTGSSRYGASFLSNASSGLDGAQLRRGTEIANQILSKRSASR